MVKTAPGTDTSQLSRPSMKVKRGRTDGSSFEWYPRMRENAIRPPIHKTTPMRCSPTSQPRVTVAHPWRRRYHALAARREMCDERPMARVKVLFHDNCFDGAASASLFSRFYAAKIDPAATFEFAGKAHGTGNVYS